MCHNCNQRNNSDEQLIELLTELGEGQTKMLQLAGALPKEVADIPKYELTSKDVARMIELSEK